MPIAQLVNWAKNPRAMSAEDKTRLKGQLLNLGQYKPLIVTQDGPHNVVLGGNMRLEAMRELSAEGHKEFDDVWVSFVEAPDEKRKLEFALSDNDRAGSYNEDQLVEMTQAIEDFPMDAYHLDTAYTMPLDTLVERYDMADVRQGLGGPAAPVDRDVNTVKDKRVAYDNATIKQIVLYFDKETFERVIADLDLVMEQVGEGCENNTEAVLWLINFWKNAKQS